MYAFYFVSFTTGLVLMYISNAAWRYNQQLNGEQDDESGNFNNAAGDSRCLWSEWSAWSQCTVTCGTGVRVRHRVALALVANCTDETIQELTCSSAVCPYDKSYIPLNQFPGEDDLFASEANDAADDTANAGDDFQDAFEEFLEEFANHRPLGNQRFHQELPDEMDHDDDLGDDWFDQQKSDNGNFFKRTGDNEKSDRKPFANDDDGHSRTGGFCSSDCGSPDSPDLEARKFFNDYKPSGKTKPAPADENGRAKYAKKDDGVRHVEETFDHKDYQQKKNGDDENEQRRERAEEYAQSQRERVNSQGENDFEDDEAENDDDDDYFDDEDVDEDRDNDEDDRTNRRKRGDQNEDAEEDEEQDDLDEQDDEDKKKRKKKRRKRKAKKRKEKKTDKTTNCDTNVDRRHSTRLRSQSVPSDKSCDAGTSAFAVVRHFKSEPVLTVSTVDDLVVDRKVVIVCAELPFFQNDLPSPTTPIGNVWNIDSSGLALS